MKYLLSFLFLLNSIGFSINGLTDPLEKEKTYLIPIDSSIKRIGFSVVFKPKDRDKTSDFLEKSGGQNFYLQPAELEQFSKIALATSGENILLANEILEETPIRDISVITPAGKKIEVTAPDTEIIDWSAGTVINILNPEPGIWKLNIVGPGNFSARATAKTDIYFIDFDFIKLSGRPGHEGYFPISKEPAIDAKQILEINFSEDSVKTQPPKFSLVDESGKDIDTLQFYTVRRGDLAEFAGVVKIPMQDFRIVANGVDQQGFKYQRIFSSAIQPKQKFSPITDADIEAFIKHYEAIQFTRVK